MKKQSELKKYNSVTENGPKHTRLNWFRGIKLVWVSFTLGGLLLVAIAPLLVGSIASQCLLLLAYACISSGFIIALTRRGQKGV